MKALANFLVKGRYIVLTVVLLLAVASIFMLPQVNVVTDMTTYLPDDSSMREGIGIMAEEFPEMTVSNTIRVMFENIPDTEKESIRTKLGEIEHVESVSFESGSERYENESNTLYILNIPFDYGSSEMKAVESRVKEDFSDKYNMTYVVDDVSRGDLPIWIIGLAVLLLIVILLALCKSWVEPLLFIVTIGAAVLINMGTNAFLDGVSEITYSIAAILQLVLSMDYSIILMNRYRQELDNNQNRQEAMKSAIVSAFSSIASSSMTTIVGLLMLVFMSFKIGEDLGIVLAKGVFISLICVLTILPALILLFDKWIHKTTKKVLTIPMGGLGHFSHRFRYVILGVFVVLFVTVLLVKGSTKIDLTITEENDIDGVFPKENQIVMLYNNSDEEAMSGLVTEIAAMEDVESVTAYANTVGMRYTAAQMTQVVAGFLGGESPFADETTMIMLYTLYHGQQNFDPEWMLSIPELLDFAVNTLAADPMYGAMLDAATIAMMQGAGEQLQSGAGQLKGENYSIMMISTMLPDESEETDAFFRDVVQKSDSKLSAEYYLIGNSAMAYEMSQTFESEFNRITILTAVAIFVVVLLTFRNILVPAVLVLLIQTAVYATMTILNIQGASVYYLALLVVQSILMGATIDYAILFTSYYREKRLTMGAKEALCGAYTDSFHTIFTSGIIIVVVTAIVGYAFADPAIRQIVHTISMGAACSILLIVFILPGVLASVDRWICRKANK